MSSIERAMNQSPTIRAGQWQHRAEEHRSCFVKKEMAGDPGTPLFLKAFIGTMGENLR